MLLDVAVLTAIVLAVGLFMRRGNSRELDRLDEAREALEHRKALLLHGSFRVHSSGLRVWTTVR